MMAFKHFLSTALLVAGCATADLTTLSFRRHHQGTIIKRQSNPDPVTLEHDFNNSEWEIELALGTPGQKIKVQLDTGSSDLWVFTAASCAQANGQGYTCNGTFSNDDSSTYQAEQDAPPFMIKYGDGSGVNGTYFEDVVQIGDFTVDSQIMGLAETGDSGNGQISTGVFGVGFDTGESAGPYRSVIDNLYHSGQMQVRAFSVFLNDITSQEGSIIFGGYDPSQWIGDLGIVPILNNPVTGGAAYFVGLTSVGVTSAAGSQVFSDASLPQPALLDSGTTALHIPASLYTNLVNYFGGVTDQDGNVAVDCDLMNSNVTVDWGFGGEGGPVISTPPGQFISPFDGSCYLAAIPTDDGQVILGDAFMTSAYVVFDQDHMAIGLAPAVLESTVSNPQAFDQNGVLGIQGAYVVNNTYNFAPLPTSTPDSLSTVSNPVPSTPALESGLPSAVATPTRYMNLTLPTYAAGQSHTPFPTPDATVGDASSPTHTNLASHSGSIQYYWMILTTGMLSFLMLI